MQQPILDRIVVKQDQGADMFGSIIIPESAVEDVYRGTVMLVGPGKDGVPCGVEAGDYVLFSAFAGTKITIDDEDLLIMKWQECLMRFREDDDNGS